jgi:hypothetical protein
LTFKGLADLCFDVPAAHHPLRHPDPILVTSAILHTQLRAQLHCAISIAIHIAIIIPIAISIATAMERCLKVEGLIAEPFT